MNVITMSKGIFGSHGYGIDTVMIITGLPVRFWSAEFNTELSTGVVEQVVRVHSIPAHRADVVKSADASISIL